jgi:hypothetical protein
VRTHSRIETIRLRMILQLCHLKNAAYCRKVCKSDRKGKLRNVKLLTSTQWTTSLVSVEGASYSFGYMELIFHAFTKLLKRCDVRYYAKDFLCT